VLRKAADPPPKPPKPIKPVRATLPHRPQEYLGVFEPQEQVSYAAVSSFGDKAGRQPNIVLYFSGWNEPFRGRFASTAWAHGAKTLVQIDPAGISLARVAAGDYDTYLTRYADAVRRFGHPVIIGFAHEMNGGWFSWGDTSVTPATWIAAWRHVVDTFRRAGADNVTWLWTINRVGVGIKPPREWWPGASYVTWVGIDGYFNIAGAKFARIFAPTIAAVRKFTADPILLSEMATYPGAPGQISQVFAGIRRNHLLGLVWFDAAGRLDWRLEASPADVAVFRRDVRQYK